MSWMNEGGRKDMEPTQTTLERVDDAGPPGTLSRVLAFLLVLAALPVGLAMGFSTSESAVLVVVAAAGLFSLLVFSRVRLSMVVKIIFLLISMTFLQRVFGYFKLESIRGLNVGNVLLLLALSYWFLFGLRRGRLYVPTPVDFWIVLTLILIPLISMYYTAAFRRVPGYSIPDELSRFKQWVTPLIYFFLVCQCFERKRDIRYLYYLTISLIALVVLEGLPEALRGGENWRGGRSEGIVAQPNDYAALLALIAPYPFLFVFIQKGHLGMKAVLLCLLALMGFSILTTYSRAGYGAFAIGLVGAGYLAYRATGKLPLNTPTIVILALCMLPVAAAPNLITAVKDRFSMEGYKTASRQSYTQARLLNQYSGDRIALWKGALKMAEENPIFGVGFHVYNSEIIKYHPKGWRGSNYCHSMYLGALAEGGIIWLSALLMFCWKFGQVFIQNWRVVVSQADRAGQIICGGGLLAYIIMLWIGVTSDFFNPGPRNPIFWITMAGAVRYGMLAREGEPRQIPTPPAPVPSAR
jgi:O-antigen ligase